MSVLSEIGSSTLLFILIFGMSATVDINNLRQQLRNRNAMLTGILLQFIILPFLGFAVVKALNLNAAMGITLLVVTSSPGGSYSNWWCSMFNADLALSVTMTAISTLMSIIMLPLNLILYSRGSYNADVVNSVDWVSLFIALGIVISAIGLGLYSSAAVHSPRFNIYANKLGSLAGLALIIYSILISSGTDDQSLWERDWKFYLGVASPCVLGLAVANMISTSFGLKKPERVTVSVECCYQNTGIATSVAITMFKGEELTQAIGVPLFYGLVEAIVLGIYCIVAWKFGWTKAPPNESICVAIGKSYEVESAQVCELTAIEVVLGSPKSNEVVFEIDDSTRSVNDDSGSIYGISYPIPSTKQQIEQYTIDERHKRTILFPVAGSPELDLELGDLEFTVIHKKDDFNDFLMNTNATFQDIHDLEKGETLGNSLSQTSAREKQSTHMMKPPGASLFSLQQNEISLSDNSSHASISSTNKSNSEPFARDIQNYSSDIISNENYAFKNTQNINSDVTSDSSPTDQDGMSNEKMRVSLEDDKIPTNQPLETKMSSNDDQTHTSSIPPPPNEIADPPVHPILNESIDPQTQNYDENLSLSAQVLPNDLQVGTNTSIEMDGNKSNVVMPRKLKTLIAAEKQIPKDITKSN